MKLLRAHSVCMIKPMRYLFLSLSLLFAAGAASSQIISRDTVCIGEPVSFSADTSLKHIQYCWEFGTSSMTPVLTTSRPIPGTGTSGGMFSVVAQATMTYDSSDHKYYAFVTSASTGFTNPTVQRLDFGSNPHSVPSVTDLGNPNGAFISFPINSNMEAIEIVKDAQGTFHAFINNGGIVHWVFGNGIASSPTQATRIYTNRSVIGMAMQLSVVYYNNEWILFAGQSYGASAIVRFDLGADLNNIPSVIPVTSIQTTPAYWPSYFALLQEAGNWYMFITNLEANSPLLRYDFGTNLKNNTPVQHDLGTFTPAINNNRGLNFIKSCDTFFMLGLNEDGTILAFDFRNDILSTPAVRSLGQVYGSGVNMQVLKPYWYNDTLWAISGNWNNNTTATSYRFPLLGIPSGNAEIKYWDPATTHVFNAPGVYNVTLYCDQADPRGPQAYCKQVVVLPEHKGFLGPDTTLCDGTSYTLDAGMPGAAGWKWNTGATTSAITVTQPGTYAVACNVRICPAADTVTIAFKQSPSVDLGPDVEICTYSPVTLGPAGGSYISPSYLWSTGDVTREIQVTQSGVYTLTVKDQGCEGSDTVNAIIYHSLQLFLGNDTSVCMSSLPITLAPYDLPPAGTRYKWSNGLADTQMQVAGSGVYWLEISLDECKASDTITVKGVVEPDIDIGPDSTICAQSPLTIGTELYGAGYAWNTGAATPYIDVSATGSYVLALTLDGCTVTDTVQITAIPDPEIDLGADRDICPEQTIVLDAAYESGSSYHWSTGAETPDISATSPGTYWVQVTSVYKCTGTDTILLRYYPPPVISLGADTTVCEETPLELHAVQWNADSLVWSDGSTGSSLSVKYGGAYIATGINKCGTGSDTVLVRQIFCDIWLPNAFTPNNDGVNDVFRILGNVGRLEGVSLSIFNRWGERIFYTGNKYQGWDGKQDGSDAMLGTYVYMLQYSYGGRPYLQKGSFHLIR